MQAFYNSQTIRDQYLARVKCDQLAGNLKQGSYWCKEKGCGCLMGSILHIDSLDIICEKTEVSHLLDIPYDVCQILERAFESSEPEECAQVAFSLLEAIPLGADLSAFADDFESLCRERHICYESWTQICRFGSVEIYRDLIFKTLKKYAPNPTPVAQEIQVPAYGLV